ncbi:hypothetical protein DNTS_021806 [Danionella cerebrum]|uniref:G-protein coupled receptors family 1 profile domain-containing protein n=1 Tax=Danionella cerebrum TaxID=2873325 RepID=A0A553R882_9TELE|nr:hypothetical protein DNTS_021806 [Danionella translucida]
MDNQTFRFSVLLVEGLEVTPQSAIPAFIVLLLVYIGILVSNIGMMIQISLEKCLHQPMYVLLCNLTVNDIMGSTVLLPRLMKDVLTAPSERYITYVECVIQAYFTHLNGTASHTVIMIMAFDRYVAICNPLRYPSIMTSNMVIKLSVAAWAVSMILVGVLIGLSARLSHCRSVIQSNFCDNASLFKLSCESTVVNNIYGLTFTAVLLTSSMGSVVLTYLNIAIVCFKSKSKTTNSKAIKTCSTHLIIYIIMLITGFLAVFLHRVSMSKMDNLTFGYNVLQVEGLLVTGQSAQITVVILLLMYIFSVVSNLGILIHITTVKSLHQPMYILFCHLPANDILGATAIIPRVVRDLLLDPSERFITYVECFLQAFCAHLYGTMCHTILMIMAFDRYVAICNPLQYPTIMNNRMLVKLSVAAWGVAIVLVVVLIGLTARLSLCRSMIQNHFCDNASIFKLSCESTVVNNLYGLAFTIVLLTSSLGFVLLTYLRIAMVCIRSKHKATNSKAAKTCSTHLAVYVITVVCGFLPIFLHRFSDFVEESMENQTFRYGILLVEGLRIPLQSSLPVLIVIFLAYVFAVVSNFTLIFLIITEKNLHDPMHFLFCNLPVNDILGTTVIVPRLLQDILRESSERYISYAECVVQAYFVHVFAAACHYVLLIMAFDRYVAICNPLRYAAVMTNKTVIILSASAWGLAVAMVTAMIGLTLRLSHCRSIIENPFCDNPSLFKLSCENISVNNTFGVVYTIIIACISALSIFITYVKIAAVCITSKNKALNSKAIQTCSTHLAVYVIMFVSGAIFIFLHRFPEYSDSRKLGSVLFHIVPPGLNPLVYGLQSKDIRNSFWGSRTVSPSIMDTRSTATPQAAAESLITILLVIIDEYLSGMQMATTPMDNLTSPNSFLLVEGLKVTPQSSQPVFIMFLVAYIFSMVSNLGLLFVISTEKNLHDPMHFLFCNLPLNDIMGTTVIVPRLLHDILSESSERYISYAECVVQAYFVHVFTAACHYVLMIMAFDRYVAICNPLRYAAVMTNKMVVVLSALAWGLAVLLVTIMVGLTVRLSHCRYKIENPFCDNASLFKLSCENVSVNNVFGLVYTAVVLSFSALSIFITYVKIAAVCITSKNKALNSKAIQTCSTHLAVYLIMFVSGAIFIFLHRFPEYSDSRKLASIMFHVVPPGLNPLVYGLQTKEIRHKVVKLWRGKKQAMDNLTIASNMLLLEGLKVTPQSSYPVFFLLLFAYLFSITCNTGLILLITMESNLHHPMHFLFCNLSLNDVLGTTVMMPRLLQDILRDASERYISYVDCAVQAYFVHTYAVAAHYVLVIMAFDRYVAICNPLRYSTIMTNTMVVKLSVGVWGFCIFMVSILLGLSIRLSRCRYKIENPFCDNASLFKLSCENVTVNNAFGLAYTVLVFTVSLGSVIITYSKIAAVCISSKSKSLNSKAIKTCCSHVIVYIIMLFSSVIIVFLHRFPEYSDNRKLSSIMFHVLPPGLNPVVYGLQTKEIRQKLGTFWHRNKIHLKIVQSIPMDNGTLTDSVLLVEGLKVTAESSYPVFILLLLVYIFIMVSNIGLILIISTEKNLHHPMHFLFCNLPVNDILGTNIILPRLMKDILKETSERYMSYVECVVQAYFVHVFAVACHYVLIIMAFDRYVAICNPLRYTAVMTNKMVIKLSAFAWGLSIFMVSILLGLSIRLSRCRYKIENPFCDNASLFKLSCENVTVNNVFGLVYTVIVFTLSLGSVFITYGKIAVVCITSKNKSLNSKAIKTCSSHIAVYLIMFVSCATFIFLHRFPEYSDTRKLASIMFHIVPPGLNPLVYGLQTKEIRQKFVKFWFRKKWNP